MPKNISNAFIRVEYKSYESDASDPSFRAPDGSHVSYIVAAESYCSHDEKHAGHWHLGVVVYYVPKLKAGTIITSPSGCRSTSFIYFTK